MARNMNISFLGTSSGGGPSISRNCSSLVVDVIGNGTLWSALNLNSASDAMLTYKSYSVVDCAEGTLRQLQMQPRGQGEQALKAGNVAKLFITHMHADHIMGIITFLRNVLQPPPTSPSGNLLSPDNPPQIELYGPAGLRTFVRSILAMTLSYSADRYVVHELLTATDTATSCHSAALHPNECPGQDFVCDSDGFWRGVASDIGYLGEVVVDAGPIQHRDPCIGYIFRETGPPFRKLVILGDTFDPSPITPLIHTSPTAPVSLLIHEATDAYIPRHVDSSARRTKDVVESKVAARGHSTPVMAGTFAKRIGAQRLVLNHIGSRFPAPKQLRNPQDTRLAVIAEIERQASEAWGEGEAVVAYDFMRVSIPAELNEDYYTVENAEVGELLENGMGERGRGGASRGRRRGHWRGRGRGRGGGRDRGGSSSGRNNKKRKYSE